MANNVSINIDLESAEALAALKKLGTAFVSTEKAVEGTADAMEDLGAATKQVGKVAPDAAKGMVSSFKKAERSVRDAGEASKELHDQLGQTAKAFFGLELGKMVAGYADEVLSAAAANESMSAQTRETAQGYLEMKQNVADIGAGMVLTVANIASSLGQVGGLSALVKETAEYWNAQVNGDKSAEAVKQEQALVEAEKRLNEVKEKKNKLIQEEKQKREEAHKAAQQQAQQQYRQEQQQLDAQAAAVRATLGTEAEKAERVFTEEVSRLDKLKAKHKLTLKEYEEATALAVRKRNEAYAAAGADQLEWGSSPDQSGQAAADAYSVAKAQADAENQAKTDSGAETTAQALAAAQHHNQQIKGWDDQLTQQRLDNLQTYLGGYQSMLATLGASNKKAAMAAKAVSFIQAVINAREAASKAWAQGGILGAFGAGAALAGGMAQAYSIKEQKFAGGGIVQGQRLTGDTVPIAANPGEMILTQAQQASLYKMSQGAQQATQLPPISIHVAAGVDALAVKKALAESMPDLQRQLAKAMGSSTFTTTQRAI